MNYKNLYNKLIQDAQLNPKPDSYKEVHHIIPLSMNGSNNKSNLVELTARQHFLAHWLLYKIHKTSKLAHAFHSMCRIGKNQDARRVNSHLFEYARKTHAKVLSESMKGDNNRFRGKKHTKESMERMVSKRFETYKNDPEREQAAKRAQGIGASKRWKGVPKSPESNAKRGRKGLLMLKNVNTGEVLRVSKENALKLDKSIWVNPYTLREKIIGVCPHCGLEKEMNSTFKRWHFDNCRNKDV